MEKSKLGNITLGEYTADESIVGNRFLGVDIRVNECVIGDTRMNEFTKAFGIIEVDNFQCVANAELFADAGNTAQKCGMLPSEILEQRNELLEALKESNKDLIVNHGHIYSEIKRGNKRWDGVDEIFLKRIESNKEIIKKLNNNN